MTYGDLKLIKLKSKEAYPLLCNERTKTNIPYKIPIVSPIVVRLLENGESFQKIFDPLTNQPTNRYLKEIMKDLKINKTMTFHRARHRENFYQLLINRLRTISFSIGNDLETSQTYLFIRL